NAHGTAALLENVDFDGNTGAAVRWWAGTSPTFRNLSASGNGLDALINTGGDVWGGQYWAVAEAGLPVYLVGNTRIRGGALLSIEPGTTLILTPTVSISDWWAEGNASLYALGTAEKPITFTGMTQTPGAWGHIDVSTNNSRLFLSNCTVEYGGGAYAPYGMIHLGGSGTKVVQNCRIRHSLGAAGLKMSSGASSPLMRNNEIYSNANYGVLKTYGPSLDARDNWWGDASGPYHATQNPGGTGDAVGEYDNVLFTPWLTAPPTGTVPLGLMIVDTGAPEFVSPGQTVDYAIHYHNGMTQTVENAVLMMQLPAAAEYVDSSHGGSYWPERDQVFWKLGNLAPDDRGLLSVRVRFQWGLPPDYQDSSITVFTSDNYNPGELDTQSYLDYVPGDVDAVSLLTTEQFNAQLAASPDLQAVYDAAIAAGYTFHSAANVTRSEGETVLEGVLVNTGLRASKILAQQGGHVLVYTINAGEVIIEDSAGGMRLDLITGDKSVWGDWETASTLSGVSLPVSDGCTADACKRNCRWSIIGWEYIKKKAGRVVAWTAFSFFTGPVGVPAAIWEIGSTVKKLYDCDLDCRANPSEYCCTAGQVRWSGGFFTRLTSSCSKEKCNAAVGLWVPDGYKTCTSGMVTGERCVAGVAGPKSPPPGCTPCKEGVSQHDLPRCHDLGLERGKDPNAKYGPAGDLLPGQLVTYTLTYENVGEGRVYGAHVTDQLADVFDADTLQIQAGGVYLPYDRTLVWMVGELGPKGDPDSEGVMTFTVRLRDDLPSGTVVRNEATVFFPSVPEETPTNPVVNLIQPLVAVPQEVETNYRQPVTITLEGLSVGALPLTFHLDELPVAGSLTGTLPVLVYTPPENFAGVDGFSFIVTNGITESRPAYVRILVNSVGDTTSPEVLWTDPTGGAADVPVSTAPFYTDESGPAYLPFPVIGFSEALSATTVTTQSIYLAPAGGSAAPISLIYDGLFNQVLLVPRAPLQYATTYTVTTTMDVRDAAGNPLTATHIWHFSTAAVVQRNIYLPLVLRNY
ncbi:MAG: Ig-like domain-containing protein, partial [Chloroflexota bacterium]|nr:Ig-like domain-containing protein [Chloroflexota bacterium]